MRSAFGGSSAIAGTASAATVLAAKPPARLKLPPRAALDAIFAALRPTLGATLRATLAHLVAVPPGLFPSSRAAIATGGDSGLAGATATGLAVELVRVGSCRGDPASSVDTSVHATTAAAPAHAADAQHGLYLIARIGLRRFRNLFRLQRELAPRLQRRTLIAKDADVVEAPSPRRPLDRRRRAAVGCGCAWSRARCGAYSKTGLHL